MSNVYVGLGGNLGDSPTIFENVLADFAQDESIDVISVSSFYVSKPLDNMQQPDYLNAVAHLLTQYSPHALLKQLQYLEKCHGRVRTGQNWASRTLDLDILLYDDLILNDAELVVPHPGMLERDFVLYPMAEISPAIEIAGYGSILSALKTCENRGLKKLNEHND